MIKINVAKIQSQVQFYFNELREVTYLLIDSGNNNLGLFYISVKHIRGKTNIKVRQVLKSYPNLIINRK